MSRLGVVVVLAVLLAALFAWYVKGDLEMAWLAIWPIIIGVTVLIAGLGSLAVPSGFPRAAVILAAAPFGVLVGWIAATTPNSWPIPPSPGHMAEARRIARDTARLQRLAREALNAPAEVAGAAVDSTNGAWQKVSGRLILDRRDPRVRMAVSFAVGPRAPLRLDVAPDGGLQVIEPVPDPAETIVRPEAIVARYADTPLVEVGGPGPWQPGQAVPLRLMRAEDDWSIEIVRVLAGGEPLQRGRTYSRTEIAAALTARMREAGLQADRFVVYFRPAGDRVLFLSGPAFDFLAPLRSRGIATVRASLREDSLVFELAEVYR